MLNLEPIFKEEKRYSPSELADLFDVTRQTIRNWALDGKLDCQENGNGREFKGHVVMRQVKNSDFLRKRLREAHGVKDTSRKDDYVSSLENTLEELKEKNERLKEDKEQREEAIFKLIDGQQELREQLQSMEEKMNNRLPEPEKSGNGSGSGDSPSRSPWLDRVGKFLGWEIL